MKVKFCINEDMYDLIVEEAYGGDYIAAEKHDFGEIYEELNNTLVEEYGFNLIERLDCGFIYEVEERDLEKLLNDNMDEYIIPTWIDIKILNPRHRNAPDICRGPGGRRRTAEETCVWEVIPGRYKNSPSKCTGPYGRLRKAHEVCGWKSILMPLKKKKRKR